MIVKLNVMEVVCQINVCVNQISTEIYVKKINANVTQPIRAKLTSLINGLAVDHVTQLCVMECV